MSSKKKQATLKTARAGSVQLGAPGAVKSDDAQRGSSMTLRRGSMINTVRSPEVYPRAKVSTLNCASSAEKLKIEKEGEAAVEMLRKERLARAATKRSLAGTSSEAGSSTEPKATKMKDLSDSAKKRTRATDAANIKRNGRIDLVSSPVKMEGCSYIA